MLLGVKVNKLVVLVVTGLKVAVTPIGSPVTLSATLATAPPVWATPMVLLALTPPTTRFSELAEDEMLKLGKGMIRATLVVLASIPDVPFTVTV